MLRRVGFGFLVAVEGVDGVGKTTASALLAQFCGERGLACTFSKEPTSGPFGARIRQSAQSGRLSLDEELELFHRDRAEHVARTIGPALAEQHIVILDRYYWSTAAYQGARGADVQKILEQNRAFAPTPDLWLLLDLEIADGLRRIRERGDQPNQFEKLESLRKSQEIFRRLARETNDNCKMIDASASLRDVSAAVVDCFRKQLAEKIHAKIARPADRESILNVLLG